MDIASVATLLSSLKSATDIAKYVKDLDVSLKDAETKLKLAELISAIADAKIEAAEVQQLILDKDERIKELEQSIELRQSLIWKEPSYWTDVEGQEDGPFCQQCYDSSSKLVRLQGDNRGHWRCTVCKSTFSEPGTRERDIEAIRTASSRRKRIV